MVDEPHELDDRVVHERRVPLALGCEGGEVRHDESCIRVGDLDTVTLVLKSEQARQARHGGHFAEEARLDAATEIGVCLQGDTEAFEELGHLLSLAFRQLQLLSDLEVHIYDVCPLLPLEGEADAGFVGLLLQVVQMD